MTKKTKKGFGENAPELDPLHKQFTERMEECGGNAVEYMRRYNRHRLKISITDEQVGKELWGNKSIEFFNEDNAINHMTFLSDLLDLLVQEENRMWGMSFADDALVERITSFVKKRVSPPTWGHEKL